MYPDVQVPVERREGKPSAVALSGAARLRGGGDRCRGQGEDWGGIICIRRTTAREAVASCHYEYPISIDLFRFNKFLAIITSERSERSSY